MEEQEFNAEIKIATLDHLGDIFLVLSQYRRVVVDEADRVGHLGFEADPILILDQLTTETIDIYMPAALVKLASADVETPVVSGVSRLVYISSHKTPDSNESRRRSQTAFLSNVSCDYIIYK